MDRLDLNGEWRLSFTDPRTNEARAIKAQVPGNVELDLMAVEPGLDFWSCENWETADTFCMTYWTYSRSFEVPAEMADKDLELVFEGIDTAADISLNGERIGYVENMFIPHVFNVTGKVRAGENTLEVAIKPAAVANAEHPWGVGASPQYMLHVADSLRKARHCWGWDNAPKVPTCGLWRPVSLRVVPKERIEEVYCHTDDIVDDVALVGVDWRIAVPGHDHRGYTMETRLLFDNKLLISKEIRLDATRRRSYSEFRLEKAHLWWPAGYGDPALYDVELILRKGGEVRAVRRLKFGVRIIRLERSETTDLEGHGEFQFYCNGVKIYVRGTNWKPLDAFHSRSSERIVEALELVRRCHCNAVRVWGGGIYEPHAFFDYCDAHGLLVWQDFMVACEYPPRDEAFLKACDEEARWLIREFRNHPCIAIWSGDNESDSVFFWGKRMSNFLRPSENLLTRRILPEAVRDCDPNRPFMPSSPYLSDQLFHDDDHGRSQFINDHAPEQHIYPQFTAAQDFRDFFRNTAAHFCSETGPFYMNAISESPDIVVRELPRVRRLWDADFGDREPQDRHQTEYYLINWIKAVRRNSRFFFGSEPTPDDPQALTDCTNLLVCEIFKFVIEFFRQHKWRRTGVIWWSLADMWPMMFNYSVLDYHLKPKRPYRWIARSQQPICLMADDHKPHELVVIHAVNDTLQDAEGDFTLEDTDGNVLRRGHYHVAANGVSKAMAVMPEDLPRGLIVIRWGDGAFNHFANGEPPWDFAAYRAMADALEK